ncbi:MAG: hypothetical protein AB1Z98_34720 [Nannocystaceae bacterium]
MGSRLRPATIYARRSTYRNHLIAELQGTAGLTKSEPHILLHTFCSHLAMLEKAMAR